jgi:hypothetical protein
MNWKHRSNELARLRAKYRASPYKIEFSDLSVSANPCTNGFGPTPKKRSMGTPAGVVVDHLHKSSMQVLFRSEIPWAGGRKP